MHRLKTHVHTRQHIPILRKPTVTACKPQPPSVNNPLLSEPLAYTLAQVLTQVAEALAQYAATQRSHFACNPSVMWRAFEDPLKLRLAVGVSYSFTGRYTGVLTYLCCMLERM